MLNYHTTPQISAVQPYGSHITSLGGYSLWGCGGIGGGAISALNELGIKLFGGVSGDCDSAVQAFLKNELDFNPNVRCSHHDHEHGDGAHTCGEHGCGKGSCHHN